MNLRRAYHQETMVDHVVDRKLVISLILSVISLALACFFVSGASKNCSILKNTAWGKKSSSSGDETYFGIAYYCENDEPHGYDDGSSCKDASDTAHGIGYTSIFLILFATVVICIRLYTGNHKLRTLGLAITTATSFLEAFATFYFYNNCIYTVKGYVAFGMLSGIIVLTLLLIVTILQAIASKEQGPRPAKLTDANRFY